MCNLRPKRSNADWHFITALVSYLHISQQRYNTTESHIGQTAPGGFPHGIRFPNCGWNQKCINNDFILVTNYFNLVNNDFILVNNEFNLLNNDIIDVTDYFNLVIICFS